MCVCMFVCLYVCLFICWHLFPYRQCSEFLRVHYVCMYVCMCKYHRRLAPHWITLFHDTFRFDLPTWSTFAQGCPNWAIDTHIYQAWDPVGIVLYYCLVRYYLSFHFISFHYTCYDHLPRRTYLHIYIHTYLLTYLLTYIFID